ncbi:MAG: helix-turn-helix domain-containing protein [Treponema sp.]|jgi:transcriptional regulator with XRE-family HTH domain|nr:helix-turn-helix domain-containing protein [Treponema sp.]
MTKLRTILAENLKTYRNEMGFSQLKLANLVDSAPNYIAMIEAGKRFPTDTMLEKIAAALRREPCELFSAAPIQKNWEEALLADFADFIAYKQKGQMKEQLLHRS